MSVEVAARSLQVPRSFEFQYSICTPVTNLLEYGEMRASFSEAGFGSADCEFLYIDNSRGNQAEAFAGYNLLLDEAQGRYVILCHQDILLNFDDRKILEQRLAELDRIDPAWGLAGNAGGIAPESCAVRVTHSTGDQNSGGFPALVQSLDENFILVKKEANLSLSRDLKGFHLHGTDLCQIARMLGWNAWVIDFRLFHKSEGTFDESFFEISRQMVQKYQRALRGRPVQTMGLLMFLSSSGLANWLRTPSRRRMKFELDYGTRRRRKRGLPITKPPEFLAEPLGPGWTVFYWVAHKIRTPIENLIRSIAKRRRKSVASNPPGGREA